MDSSRHVKIFDTTLRDGQQCPGAGMSFEANIEYAQLARGLGIDVLEAGFPAASQVDFEIVQKIAEEVSGEENSPEIAGLCQLRDEQVDITIESLQAAIKPKRAKLHTYVPVDPELMKASLGDKAWDKAAIVKNVYDFCKRAVDAGLSVEFSPEGYSRMGSNFDFVTDLIRAAVSAGAGVINCPDTIGGAYRLQGENYFVEHMNRHAEVIDKEFPKNSVTWSVHCHNDFGLALDNSLNGIFNGPARQVEGCINGVGERAGNVALEQCVVLIKNFGETLDSREPFFTKIKAEGLQEISNFVDRHMLDRQRHWPVVGKNSARHSSGGHTNAVLNNPLVYQPFDPGEVGNEVSLVFGPLSGGNHAKSIVQKHGYKCEESEKAQVAQFIKDYYKDRRKGVTDEELMEAYFHFRKPVKAEEIDYSKTANTSEVILRGEFFGISPELRRKHRGKDSALAALKGAIDESCPGLTIESHTSQSEGSGVSAKSVSRIIVSDKNEKHYEGEGEDQDIELSAMKALVNAVNRYYVESNFRK